MPSDTDFDPRRLDLRRMRRLATSLLVLMAALFIATSLGMARYAWLAYVRAFAEAAMVGGCADWFAVVALFQRPFGLPIPHTGIIPRNKERIGEALGRFVTNNFLARPVLAAKLDQIDAAHWCAGWLREPRTRRRLRRYLRILLPRIAKALETEQGVVFLSQLAQNGLAAVPAAPVASKVLALLWAQRETQALLDRAITLAESSLIKRQDLIRRKVSQSSSRLVPKWVDARLADKVIAGLLSTFADMRAPQHPWRLEFRDAVEKLIDDLAKDPAMRIRGEAIKSEILRNQLFKEQIDRLCRDLESTAGMGVTRHAGAIATSLEAGLIALGDWMEKDTAPKRQLNEGIRRAALHMVLSRRQMIGAYLTQVVSTWDTSTLVDKLELQCGKDLQYIRINGTLVGGFVGLALYSVSHWLAWN